MNWLDKAIAIIPEQTTQEAKERQLQLTKPAGSLGMLEEIAIKFSAIQQTQNPQVNNIHISVFAADHGIANENVSAFPQVVTTEMVKNFLQQAAMTNNQIDKAFDAGIAAVQRAIDSNAHVFIGGDMGIANTTSATAMACVYLDKSPLDLTGAGTGLDEKGVAHKAKIIEQALTQHEAGLLDELEILRFFGGFEIAALTAAYIYAAQQGLPVVIDGFIATAAALAATKIKPGCDSWFIYAHQSHEQGHRLLLEALNAVPLVNLNMRLGEASGAAVVIPLLQHACALHANMATFAEAGVSTSDG